MESKKIKILVLGAGERGYGYAECLKEVSGIEVDVVGVAEPRDAWRTRMVEEHQISSENVFTDWKDALARERFADAVFICTQDRMHTEPAIACAGRGYHILLEKPMAPSAEECVRIIDAVKRAHVHFAVCHVLRYTDYSRKLRALVEEGAIGDVVSVQHLEPVGFFHQAHSYVRGNWRREESSSFMLLAKSCHDLDWIRYVVGKPFKRVSSFGSLMHFKEENKPAGAADRCLSCSVEESCPYSAEKIYLDPLVSGETGWPMSVVTSDQTEKGMVEALTDGPYGRCVYSCDNDVVDHQVVAMEFDGGATGTFTMTAFTRPMEHRKTTLFGTHGEIRGNGQSLEVYDFLTRAVTVYDELGIGEMDYHHGGADQMLVRAFVEAIAYDDPSRLLSGLEETLESHLAVFSAEEARLQQKVVKLD
jgi:predicted dehydrogenase